MVEAQDNNVDSRAASDLRDCTGEVQRKVYTSGRLRLPIHANTSSQEVVRYVMRCWVSCVCLGLPRAFRN